MKYAFIVISLLYYTTSVSAQKAWTKFFAQSIRGDKVEYRSKRTLKPSAIETTKAKAWAAYRKTLNEHFAYSLPPLQPLDSTSRSAWTLPADLQPDCHLPFFYGHKGAKPAEGYPLFLYIHGSGPKEMEWQAGLKWCSVFDDAPSVYFIPQIPSEKRYRWYQREKQAAWEALLRGVLASDDFDPKRIYLLGISEGGYGSQRLASFYADYLAAAGPMAGGEPLRNAPVENLQHIAFTLRTGEHDNGFYRNKLTRYTAEALDSIANVRTWYAKGSMTDEKTAENNHTDEYRHWVNLESGRGHGIDYTQTPTWMKQHTRRATPTHFVWEQYPMDDRYRTSWYNLVCLDSLDAQNDERRRFEMSIQDNVVELHVSRVTYIITEKDPQWGIQLKCKREYTPVSPSHLTIYLDNTLIDSTRPVVLRVNGEVKYAGEVKAEERNIINSIATFGDPLRIYPMSVGY